MKVQEISTYKKRAHWLILGLLSIILSYFTLLNAYAQRTNSTSEKNPRHFIRRWLALGPFIEGKTAPEAIEEDYLKQATGIPEAQFATPEGAPKAGDSAFLTLEGYATQERIWKILVLPEDGSVNRMFVEDGNVDFAVAYLLTFIESKEAMRRKLMIGSDDAVKVWLNGEVIHTAAVERGLMLYQDGVVVNLQKGMNCLMLKVADSTVRWGIAVGFADESGLHFYDTPSRQPVPLGKRLVRFSEPKVGIKPGMGKEGLWETYRYVDGLAGNQVCAIFQDKEGTMWFGTYNSVSRFDGVSWKTYTVKDGLAKGSVLAIFQDKKGAMWFGTESGVSRFDGVEWKTYTTEDGLAHGDVGAILQDKKGTMWFGTDGGVSRFDGVEWKTYTTEDGLAHDDVSAILQDKEGTMWFGTYKGVSRFDGVEWKTYTTEDGLAHNTVRTITQDKRGAMWFGTHHGGVSCFDGVSWTTYTTEDGLAKNHVRAILQDKEGTMWFGTWNGGVSRFDGKEWKTYTREYGLADNLVFTIFQDREGAMWFGTWDGVNRFDSISWTTYTTEDGLAHNDVNAIFQDKEGTMWFGTYGGGVSKFDEKKWTIYTTEDGLTSDHIFAIFQDKKGTMWFGTRNGVSRFDGVDWTTYTTEDGLTENTVRDVFQDKEGMMWFGTHNGVSRFDGVDWTTYAAEDGLAENTVRAILQDNEGTIWFGTEGGVSCFDGRNWRTYTTEDGLAHNDVDAIIQDKQGMIWFGTEGGVSCFDGRNWRTYTTGNGLAHNDVDAIIQDKQGMIWFGTSGGGVSKFDGTCCQNIDSRDGLASDYLKCVYMDRSGQIWFGTRFGGVNRFIPNKFPPTIHITQVLADEKTYPSPDDLKLHPGVKRVAFGFRASSFKTRPGKMKYFYQLVKKDLNWQGPTNEEIVEYFNLKPGLYTFRVQAVDRDLNYSHPPASVEITIPPPPFYKRTSFVVTVSGVGGVLLIIVIVLAVNQWRLSQKEQKRLRQELDDARQMQTGLLPETAPSVPGFEIYGFSQPAREVGGDFYDYLTLDANLICIALADVSDKGLRAAMNAVMTNGMLYEAAKSEQSAAGARGRAPLLLNALNAGLCSRLQHLTNVAFALFILDPQTRTLTYANAGQPLPLVKRQEDVWEAELIGGLPLGSMADYAYEENTIELQSGDCVILYTDGISEAINEAEEIYGEQRLIEAIRQADMDISAEEMINRILQDVMAFIGRAEQYDDMTLVVVRCLGDSSNGNLIVHQTQE